MSDPRLDPLRESYRATLAEHGTSPGAVKLSAAGQRERFAQLAAIDDLSGHSVIDVGCGLGYLYEYLREHLDNVEYTGVDLVPEMAERASERFPEASFAAVDVLAEGLPGEYDYVLLSGVFNDAMKDATGYLRDILGACWPAARLGLGFNFISSHAQQQAPDALSYHDPAAVLDFCLGLSPYVDLQHFYARADVSVFIRRGRPSAT